MLELLFSLVLGWNLIGATETEPLPFYTFDRECVTAIWHWDGEEWLFWDTDMPFYESDFFFPAPEGTHPHYAHDIQTEHIMQPGNAYWVYCDR